MGRATTPVSLILCLVLSTLPGQSLSQTQPPPPPDEAQRQKMQQFQQEQRQRAEEMRQRSIQRQEEFWQRVDEQARQRLQDDWPNLTEEERQRRQESLRKSEEQHQQMLQRQRDFWQHATDQEKQTRQRAEEQRRRYEEEQRLIRKVANEYADEVWQEALDATPKQWKALKPRLEKIHQLKETPWVDISIYWIGGSTSYQEESLVESADGARSVAKASGWFSVTSGAGSTAESYACFGASGDDRIPPLQGGHSSSRYGSLPSGGYSATMRTTTAPHDSNRPPARVEIHHRGTEDRQALAYGAIKFGMQVPGPVKKQVGDIDLGWQWERPSLDKGPDVLNEGEKACERLVDLFESEGSDAEEVRQRVEALRQARAQDRPNCGRRNGNSARSSRPSRRRS